MQWNYKFVYYKFSYLASDEYIEKSRIRLADILEYELSKEAASQRELKRPEQLFLGLEAGQLVSLADQKVFEPTHPTLVEYYRGGETLADHLR